MYWCMKTKLFNVLMLQNWLNVSFLILMLQHLNSVVTLCLMLQILPNPSFLIDPIYSFDDNNITHSSTTIQTIQIRINKFTNSPFSFYFIPKYQLSLFHNYQKFQTLVLLEFPQLSYIPITHPHMASWTLNLQPNLAHL